MRRISYLWPDGVQTSDGGSYYLCQSGRCNFSGSLYVSVPIATLTPTQAQRWGWAWIFHHNRMCAHNGVTFQALFALYNCSAPPPNA